MPLLTVRKWNIQEAWYWTIMLREPQQFDPNNLNPNNVANPRSKPRVEISFSAATKHEVLALSEQGQQEGAWHCNKALFRVASVRDHACSGVWWHAMHTWVNLAGKWWWWGGD